MKILPYDKRKYYCNLMLVFLLIYISEDVLVFGTNSNRAFFVIKAAFVSAALCLLLLLDLIKGKKYHTSSIVTVILLAINLVSTCVFWSETDNRNVYTFVLMLLSVVVVNRVSKSEFILIYTKIMKFLAIFSLVQYALFLLAYPITLFAPQTVNNNGLQFSNWIFTVSLNKEFYYIMPYRNWGIYREPGVYIVFLVLALMLETFCMPNPKKRDIVVYSITIITTFSTAGYIVLAIVLLTYIIQSIGDRRKKVWGLLGIVAAILLTVLCVEIFDIPVYNWVFKKLNFSGGSTGSRVGAVLSNIALFVKSPFLGTGWIGMAENSATIQTIVVTHHNTNTLLIYFAVYGVVYGCAMLWGSIRFFITLKPGIIGLLMALCWILALSNENLTLNNVIYLVSFYGLVYGAKKDTSIEDGRECIRV